MRQQNFPSLFSVFDALSGFSAFVVVVNLILIGGRSIKPVPISYPLSPLPSLAPSLINSYAAVAIPLFVLPQLCLCVRVCVVCCRRFFSYLLCALRSTLSLSSSCPTAAPSAADCRRPGAFCKCVCFLFLFFFSFFYQLGKHSAPTVHSVA